MTYELRSGKAGEADYTPYGAASKFMYCQAPEVMLSGPAETGKTLAACWKLHILACKYPGAQLAIVRKTYKSMIGSVLQTFEKRVIPGAPVVPYGGERPEWYDYANGSRVWVGGMDNPDKVLSSERDAIYINQAEELAIDDYEKLTTRATGRAGNMPYAQVMGDCNPGPSKHWILSRRDEGRLVMLESRHEDNPTLFDQETGLITGQGRRTLATLDGLTGVRYLRLRKGIWAAAEGIVYEEFDRAIHLIPRFEIPATWRRIRSIDFGYTNPFSCSWYAFDHDGRMYRYRQIYMTRRTVKVHAEKINALSAGEKIEATVCDWDAEDRATLEENGIPTTQAQKAISVGIEKVKERLKRAGDGKPRIYLLEDSLVEADEELREKRKPLCTEDEFEVYSWPKAADGKPIKEIPLDLDNHGLDETRYAVMYADEGIATAEDLAGLGNIDGYINRWR